MDNHQAIFGFMKSTDECAGKPPPSFIILVWGKTGWIKCRHRRTKINNKGDCTVANKWIQKDKKMKEIRFFFAFYMIDFIFFVLFVQLSGVTNISDFKNWNLLNVCCWWFLPKKSEFLEPCALIGVWRGTCKWYPSLVKTPIYGLI